MRLRTLRKTRQGRYLALLGLFALFFQLVGTVAYACAQPQMPTKPMATMTDCDSMAMPPPEAPGLCERHCDPDTPTSTDARAGHVPPLALAAPAFGLEEAVVSRAVASHYLDVPVCRSDPPPTLRFCSLLI